MVIRDFGDPDWLGTKRALNQGPRHVARDQAAQRVGRRPRRPRLRRRLAGPALGSDCDCTEPPCRRPHHRRRPRRPRDRRRPASSAACTAWSSSGATRVGSSWRGHYDRLHLHTPRELSGLPGLPIPREMGRWVARDDVVRYLELYAAHHDLDVRLGAEVRRLDRSADGRSWTRDTRRRDDGDGALRGGRDRLQPHTPRAGRARPARLLGRGRARARTTAAASAHAGKDVLVVGTGNTGTELAVDLAEHGASTGAHGGAHRAAHPAPQPGTDRRPVHRHRRPAPAHGPRRPRRARSSSGSRRRTCRRRACHAPTPAC